MTKCNPSTRLSDLAVILTIGIGPFVFFLLPASSTAQVPPIGPTKETCGGQPCRGSSPGYSAPRYTPPSPPPRSPAEIAFDQGVAAEKAGNWKDAEEAFRRALQRETGPQTLLLIHEHLSQIYWKLGRLEEAISAVRAALRLDPNDSWSKGQLAALLTDRLADKQKAGITEGAEQDYREALALNPDSKAVRSWASWIEDIHEAQRAKGISDRLLDSLNSKTNTGTGSLTVIDIDSTSESGKPQPASTGGLKPLGSDAFTPGNPPPAEVKSYLEPRSLETGPSTTSVSTKAGDQLKSASTLQPNEGSEKQASEAARRTFDTAGKDAGSLPSVNIGARIARTADGDPIVSEQVRKARPKIAPLERQREALKKQRQTAHERVAKIEEALKTATDSKARGDLLVKRTNAIQTETNLTNQIYTVNFHIEAEIPKPSATPIPKATAPDGKAKPRKK